MDGLEAIRFETGLERRCVTVQKIQQVTSRNVGVLQQHDDNAVAPAV